MILERGFYYVSMILAARHVPVLAADAARIARDRGAIVDCTAGGGGHTELFVASGARVLAADRDPDAVARVRHRLGDAVTVVQGRFGETLFLDEAKRFGPDLVFLDLGVSSQQLDDDARGFSFRRGVALDMRMGAVGPTAGDLLNTLSIDELRTMFREQGDERRAGALAREISRRRTTQRFQTSDDLVNAIRSVLGSRAGPADFARLFQAVRISVNDELGELRAALPRLRLALQTGGDLAVISYHSGEDRVVKHTFRDWAKQCVCDPKAPVCTCRGKSFGAVLTKKPIVPSAEEIAANPRARSAKLRLFRVSS